MKRILFTLILSVIPFISYAQDFDSLKLGKSSREFFIKGDQKFKFSEYKKVFTNDEALKYMKKSNSNSTIAQIFGGIGGGLIGFGLVKEITKNKKTYSNGVVIERKESGGWGLIGIGLGAIGIGIPFALSSSKNLKKAVETQNSANSNKSSKTTSYRLDISGSGVGLSYNF